MRVCEPNQTVALTGISYDMGAGDVKRVDEIGLTLGFPGGKPALPPIWGKGFGDSEVAWRGRSRAGGGQRERPRPLVGRVGVQGGEAVGVGARHCIGRQFAHP